jgi:hypothetical protein
MIQKKTNYQNLISRSAEGSNLLPKSMFYLEISEKRQFLDDCASFEILKKGKL